jgi:hypothetical protein
VEYLEEIKNKNSITRVNGKTAVLKWYKSYKLVNLEFFKVRKYYWKTKKMDRKKFSQYLKLEFSIYFVGNTKYQLPTSKYKNQYNRIDKQGNKEYINV